MNNYRLLAYTLASALITGCSANWNSIHHEFDHKTTGKTEGELRRHSKVISVDAKQRLAISDAAGKFCSEPSPDAMAALASSLGLNVSNSSDVSGNVASSTAENVANMGLRTQSIQLMRDAMYRICELERNDALNDSTAFLLHSGYQDVMIAVLSIEQLTGAVTGPNAVLGGSTQANLLQNLKDLDALKESLLSSKTAKEIEKNALQTELAALQKAHQEHVDAKAKLLEADPPRTEIDKEAADELIEASSVKVEEKEAEISARESEIDSLVEQLEMVEESKSIHQALATKADANGQSNSGSSTSTVKADTVKDLSIAVESIASKAFNRERVMSACILHITNQQENLSIERAKVNEQIIASFVPLAVKFETVKGNQVNALEKAANSVSSAYHDLSTNLDKARSQIESTVTLCKDYMTHKKMLTDIQLEISKENRKIAEAEQRKAEAELKKAELKKKGNNSD